MDTLLCFVCVFLCVVRLVVGPFFCIVVCMFGCISVCVCFCAAVRHGSPCTPPPPPPHTHTPTPRTPHYTLHTAHYTPQASSLVVSCRRSSRRSVTRELTQLCQAITHNTTSTSASPSYQHLSTTVCCCFSGGRERERENNTDHYVKTMHVFSLSISLCVLRVAGKYDIKQQQDKTHRIACLYHQTECTTTNNTAAAATTTTTTTININNNNNSKHVQFTMGHSSSRERQRSRTSFGRQVRYFSRMMSCIILLRVEFVFVVCFLAPLFLPCCVGFSHLFRPFCLFVFLPPPPAPPFRSHSPRAPWLHTLTLLLLVSLSLSSFCSYSSPTLSLSLPPPPLLLALHPPPPHPLLCVLGPLLRIHITSSYAYPSYGVTVDQSCASCS